MVDHPGRVYLIHLDEGLLVRQGPNGPVFARHYIGWSADGNLPARLAHHAAGNGSAFMAEVGRRGIAWRVVRVWQGDRNDERRIKDRREAPRFCPVCVSARGDGRGLLQAHVPELAIDDLGEDRYAPEPEQPAF